MIMGRRDFSSKLAEECGLAIGRYPLTEDEFQKAEEALAGDLEKLSLVDHEKILLDIYGFATGTVEEDGDDGDGYAPAPEHGQQQQGQNNKNTLIEEKINAVQLELKRYDDTTRTTKKSAYEQALYLSPDYVHGREFLLNFLRCADYDVSLAAEQIIQHFATKRKLFGAGNVLGRPILLSDLTKGAMECLEMGFLQVLPSRDAAGRVVTFMAQGYAKFDAMDDMHRAIWYFIQVTSSEERFTKDGVVTIQYNLGKYGTVMDFDAAAGLYSQTFDGAPVKMAAGHFCYDQPELDRYITSMTLFEKDNHRHRWRSHLGRTVSEVCFKLQTYGIPTDELPINDEETLELGWHQEWIESQRKRESMISAQSFLVPRRFDVLFGRGSDTRVHVGNLRAVHVVGNKLEEYEKASKQGKTAIAASVVNEIKASYGRFLKWDEGGWIEVDSRTARNKVSHFFRRARMSTKDQPEKQVST